MGLIYRALLTDIFQIALNLKGEKV
jgi:hypothetical protein